jgi:hypothetical protein
MMTPSTLNGPPAGARTSSRILVAGDDPARRAAVLHDLSESLPAGAQLGEAGAMSEVLERASSSSVVMLAGDIGGLPAESAMQLLGHRHPSLPVVALGRPLSRTRRSTTRRGGRPTAGTTRRGVASAGR